MNSEAISHYEGALSRATELKLVSADGRIVPLDIDRYLADADCVDRTVVERAVAPVLDVGCGPGRIVHALAAAGLPALGVDIADVAVALTTDRGAPALIRSVFDRVPGEGRWPTVLVLDGNIGIGGDVPSLLRRLCELIAPGGQLIIEAGNGAHGVDEVLLVRFSQDEQLIGPEFMWAVVDVPSLIAYAAEVGLAPADYWSAGGRTFIRFERAFEALEIR